MSNSQYTTTTKQRINKKKLYQYWDKVADIVAKVCTNYSSCGDCPFSHMHKNAQLCTFGLFDAKIEELNGKETDE